MGGSFQPSDVDREIVDERGPIGQEPSRAFKPRALDGIRSFARSEDPASPGKIQASRDASRTGVRTEIPSRKLVRREI